MPARGLGSGMRRGLALVAVAAGTSGQVRAEPSVSLALAQPPAGDHALVVAGADARGAGTWRARVGVDYASEPLVVLDAGQRAYRIVSDQLWFDAALSLSLAHRFLLFADLPLVLVESGEPGPTGLAPGSAPALGDARFGARVRLLGRADSPLKLAGGAEFKVPTASEPWAGDGSFAARPLVSASAEGGRLGGGLELSYLFRPSERVPSLLPLRTGSELGFGFATSARLDPDGELRVGPELTLGLTVGDGARPFDARSTFGQVLLGARWVPSRSVLAFAAGAGPGFGQGPRDADFRVLASVSFSPEAPPPLPDADGDRVPDEREACPSVRGRPSEDPMMNGCPELPTDTDGDAIPDVFDACPRRPGPGNADRRLHGCPSPPFRPATPPAAELVAEQIVISEQVQFETGTAELKAESDAILAQVARVLAEHPEIEALEVQGHTDTTGPPELNQRLSEERARAVVAWLVARGIETARLSAAGYGQDRPIADNDSEAGRAKNRRVEFRVFRSKRGGAPP